MAIIIPSKSIYAIENNKLLSNNITGVSYSENEYTYNVSTIYENSNIVSNSSPTPRTLTSYSKWVNENSSTRKRYVFETVFYSALFSVSTQEEIKISNLKMLVSITTTGNLSGKNLTNYGHYPKYTSRLETIENVPAPLENSDDHTNIADFCNKIIAEKTRFALFLEPTLLLVGWVNRINVRLQFQTSLNGVWTDSETVSILSPQTTVFSVNLFFDYSSSTSTPISVGDETTTFSLEENELLQNKTLINDTPIGDYIATQILESYKNGRETATIRCSVNNYFDENGKKVISIDGDRMLFKIYDEVIPHVYTSQRTDVPMSKYRDGTAKKFVVCGTNLFYDGAVWQELTLIEV